MKLKRKLISLSLLVSAFVGFCVFENVVEAKPRSGSCSGVLKNSVKINGENFNRRRGSEFKARGSQKSSIIDENFSDFRDNEDLLNKLESFYYEKGLDRCQNKPFFYIAAEGGVMEIYFSPSMLKELSQTAANLNNFKIKITDSHGKKYVISDTEKNTSSSLVDGRDYYYRALMQPRSKASSLSDLAKNDFLAKNGFVVDEGFAFNVGAEYLIELFDSKGNKVVEESCCCEDLSRRDCVPNNIIKKIAHPRKFDRPYWKERLNDRKRVFAQLFNKRLNDYHSSKGSEFKARGSQKSSVIDENFSDFRDNEDLLNKLESFYYEKGLDRCQNKPFFYIAAEGGVMEIYFSPSMLKELSQTAANLNNFKIKITDSHGKKYVISDTEKNTSSSLVDGRDFYYRALMQPRSKASLSDLSDLAKNGFVVDEGFAFNVGAEYLIELFDSKGNKVVEESCCCEDLSRRDCVPNNIIKKIAHPRKFDRPYWKERLNDRKRGVAQLFDKRLNDYHK